MCIPLHTTTLFVTWAQKRNVNSSTVMRTVDSYMQIDTDLLELLVLRPVPHDSNLELWNANRATKKRASADGLGSWPSRPIRLVGALIVREPCFTGIVGQRQRLCPGGDDSGATRKPATSSALLVRRAKSHDGNTPEQYNTENEEIDLMTHPR